MPMLKGLVLPGHTAVKHQINIFERHLLQKNPKVVLLGGRTGFIHRPM